MNQFQNNDFHILDFKFNRKIKIFGKFSFSVPCLTSSRENKTPPIGAPNATDTPAAAAAESISRIFASLWRYFGKNRATKRPQQHATWTKGPSLPNIRPAATANGIVIVWKIKSVFEVRPYLAVRLWPFVFLLVLLRFLDFKIDDFWWCNVTLCKFWSLVRF